jgi:RHS repeat-associated protein
MRDRVNCCEHSWSVPYSCDEQGHLLGEYDGAGKLIQETVWLGDTPVATLRLPAGATSGSASVFYVHADHLNTPRRITRPADNKVMWQWESEPFGNTRPNENPQGQGTFVYALRFPGQVFDGETGLAYNFFRDYDSDTGRYRESDPVGLAGGSWSTYSYVEGNPVGDTDPLGLMGGGGNHAHRNPPYTPPSNNCATAECAAGVLPAKNDCRTQSDWDQSACETICGWVTPGPPIPINIKGGAKSGASWGACKLLCSNGGFRNSVVQGH